MSLAALEAHFESRRLKLPEGLATVYGSDLPSRLSGVLCQPASHEGTAEEFDIPWIESLIDASDWPLLPNLVPIMVVDEQSFACVVASSVDDEVALPGEGAVVRWHLGVEREEQQAAMLDTDCLEYVRSVAQELEARHEGLKRVIDEIGPAYELQYLEIGKRPRDFDL